MRILSCLLVLAVLLGQPVSCIAVGAAPSSSGSEIQDRLTKGSEAEREQKERPSSPEVAAAAKELEETLATKYGVPGPDNSENPWRELIAQAKRREFLAPDLSASQLADAIGGVNRLLSHTHWRFPSNGVQRLSVGEQLLNQIANFPEPHTESDERNNCLAISQSLLFKYPALVALDVTSRILSNTYKRGSRQVKKSSKPHPNQLATDQTAGNWVAAGFVEEAFYEIVRRAIEPLNLQKIDTPQLQQAYERLSGSSKGSFVLKNGSPFVLSEPDGSHKLFANDTNYLNWTQNLNGHPLVLRNADTGKGYRGNFEYAPGDTSVTEDTVIFDNRLCERIRIKNQLKNSVEFTYSEGLDHTFADMFEVRGWKRSNHGEQLPTVIDRPMGHIRFACKGLDGAVMSTNIQIMGSLPSSISDHELAWSVLLPAGKTFETTLEIIPYVGDAPYSDEIQYTGDAPGGGPVSTRISQRPFDTTSGFADADYSAWRGMQANVVTDNGTFNKLIEQAYRDLYVLREQTPKGPAIAAGLPWFACAFGRDDAITSLQTLPFMPELSRNVLCTLAAYQGMKDDQKTAEKPGKIMHELRVGEMARSHEIPFAPYYGTVDATPLWLLLLGRYVEQTGDLKLAQELKPNIDRALEYLDAEVARGNGYLTYGGVGKEALSNQGWKDSGDSVFHSDGKLAHAPIAICEVQGYLYEGWRLIAKVLRKQGDETRAAKLEAKAEELKKRFHHDFWMEKRNYVAEALDGSGRQVDIITSNPGQLLMTGLLTKEQADAVAEHLMQKDMFSGYGIRTLARGEPRYFSNSYHDGSIWPHDNSLIVCGLHDYAPRSASAVMWSLFNAAQHQGDLRLPELFGGYPRDAFSAPIPYPVSCKPQAWAAGAMLLMLHSCSGVHLDGIDNCLTIGTPSFPSELNSVTIKGLHVGQKQVDMRFVRSGDAWTGEVTANPGNVEVRRRSGT